MKSNFPKGLSLSEKLFFKIIDDLNRKGAHTNPEKVQVNIRNFLEFRIYYFHKLLKRT
jgi:hypothetical protein